MDDNGKRDKYMDLAMEALKSSSLIVSNYSEGEERERQLNKLLKLMENYCELDIHFENSKKAMRKAEKLAKKRAEEGEDIDDISFYKIYMEVMDKMKESAPDAKDTINFKVFKEHIERLQPKEAADVQDDVEMSQFSLNPIDPITKRTMVNPVRSSQCGHTFGKESIESLLKLKTSTRCPIPGCPHKITKKDLEPDLQMQQFLQKMARNQQQPRLS